MTLKTPILIFSSIMALFGLYKWLRYKVSRAWPQTRARIVETKPQTLFEHGNLNLDSDFMLVYRVEKEKYRKVVDVETSTINIGGIKIWRRIEIPDKILIRYNPNNPADFIYPPHERIWVFLFAVAGIGAALYVVLWANEMGLF